MNTLRTGQAEVRGSNESGQLDSSGESSEGEETDDDYKSDAPDSEDDSNDVVLSFIASDEECRRAASYNTLRTSSNKKS